MVRTQEIRRRDTMFKCRGRRVGRERKRDEQRVRI